MAACKMNGDDKGPDDGDEDPAGFTVFGRCLLLLCVLLLLASVAAWVTGYVYPGFSIQIQGLEGLNPSRNSTVSAPAFNLTVHVDNKKHLRRVCWEEMAVVVYYNEARVGYNETSVGWSTLPAFCVERRSAVDLDVTLPKDGVFLSQALRDKMARDRQGAGIKLSVEIKPIDPDDDSSKACFQLCETKLGESRVEVRCLQFC